MSQFQLFPPPSPEARVSTNPFRKGKKKLPADTSPVPLEDLKNSGKTEAVLLQIIEDTNTIPVPPKAHIPERRSPVQESAPRSSSRQNARPERQASSATAATAETGSTTLVNGSNKSLVSPHTQSGSPPPPQRSPNLPMRSIFPRYDFNLPLSQQPYYPQASSGVRTRTRPRRLTLSPPPVIDQVLGPKTAPASAMGLPAGTHDLDEIQYSSLAELKGLWEAANGQRPEDLMRTYNLRMERTEAATFTLGDSQQPFYTLNTYSNNELCISRADPSKPNTNTSVPIMMLTLEDRERREPPNDGLVTHVFSRLAAMLAIEQASQIKEQHCLSSSEAARVEADALKRASALESHRLSWNHRKQIYELTHTALSLRQKALKRPALVGTAGVALSPVQKQYSGTLHITISPSPSDGDSGSSSRNKPPTIAIGIPASSNSIEGVNGPASPRTSTLPLSDSDEPLVSLDLATMTLSVSALTILAIIPSLYAIDTLVAALLAVAVSDETTNPVLGDMPTAQEKEKSQRHSQYHPNSFRGKKLITTLAEREDYDFESEEEDNGEGEGNGDRDQGSQSGTKTKKPTRNPFSSSFWTKPKKGKGKNKLKKRRVVIEEFDMEKYGRYGSSSSRAGKKLPGLVRGILQVLFWALDVFVRGMAAMVKVLAWMLVNGTRCVTSDKF